MIDEINEDYAIGRTEFDSPEVDNIVRVIDNTKVGNFEEIRITDANEFELIGKVCY